jgi:hypothetical protein
MRPILPALPAVLALGCGGAAPAVEAPGEGLPLTFPPHLAPEVAALPPAPPEPTPPAPGERMGPCPLRWTPRELHGSVFVLPAELHGRFMAPLLRAACACTRPGQSIALVARLVPEHGEVTAVTADSADVDARASKSIDACLAKELGAGLYAPFHVGSDVVCDPPPPPHARHTPDKPAPLWIARRCVPDEESITTITYPLHVDRRGER